MPEECSYASTTNQSLIKVTTNDVQVLVNNIVVCTFTVNGLSVAGTVTSNSAPNTSGLNYTAYAKQTVATNTTYNLVAISIVSNAIYSIDTRMTMKTSSGDSLSGKDFTMVNTCNGTTTITNSTHEIISPDTQNFSITNDSSYIYITTSGAGTWACNCNISVLV